MRAITKILAAGGAIAAVASAVPAAAQPYPGYGYPGYGYPGYGYGNPYGGNVIGQVLNDVLGNGYGNYGVNNQVAVNQCAAAVQQRLNAGYGYNNYGAGGRVLGISRVEPRSDGGLTVRGVASSGRYAGYGYGGQGQVDLTWRCRTDYRGLIRSVDLNPAQRNYGYGNNYGYDNGYRASPYANDYSQYGYSRY